MQVLNSLDLFKEARYFYNNKLNIEEKILKHNMECFFL